MNPRQFTTTFDDASHRRVLGIAADAPLCNWYDLLGVARDVRDEEALRQALHARFSAVRRYQSGSLQAQALELLDALGQAFICLTDPDDRRAYDAALDEIESEPPVAEVVGEITEPTTDAAANRDVCPFCGKPSPHHIPVCYQCGKRKVPPQPVAEPEPEEFLMHLSVPERQALLRGEAGIAELEQWTRELKLLKPAFKLGDKVWQPPSTHVVYGINGTTETIDKASQCYRCRDSLPTRSSAYAFEESTLAETMDYLQDCARRLQSLGRDEFTWPLSEADAHRVQAFILARKTNQVRVYCLRCARKVVSSPHIPKP